MMKVDIHNHVLPEQWPDLKGKTGYGGWVQLEKLADGSGRANMVRDGTVFRTVDRNCYDTDARIADMNRDGVSVQVLSTVPIMFNYWAKAQDGLDMCQFLNDDIAARMTAHPERFLGLGTLPMQSPELAVTELKRCVTDLNFPGVQIGSHINDWNLDDPHLHPVYATAQELDAKIFVHPWDMPVGGRMSKYWLPWLVGMPAETCTAICSVIFGGILEKFPRLKFCFAHGGGSFPYTLGRIEHGFRARPDLCAAENNVSPMNYIGRMYTDSLVHDAEALRYLVKVIGEDHVMLGTDYPFPLGEQEPGSCIMSCADFTPEEKEKLLSVNALHFLGVTADSFADGFGEGGVPIKKRRCPSGEQIHHCTTEYGLLKGMGP